MPGVWKRRQKISLLKSARLVQTLDADRRVYLLAGPDAEQPGVLQDLVLKPHLAARMAGRKDCPKEEFSCVLPLDVEGAAAEILEEYQALERDGGRTIDFSGGSIGER